MATINFKMSDSDKFEKLWSLLNTNYTEEGNWTIDCVICDVYDDYCVIRNYADNSFERVHYNKTEDDGIEITGREACYIMDLSESEKNILAEIQRLNNGTYEKADEIFASVETLTQEKADLEVVNNDLTEKNSEFEQKILDANETISTLETERDEIQASFDAQTETLNSLNTELDNLKQYKLDIEDKQKEDLFAQYSSKLDNSVIEEYKGKASEFTVDGLDRELAYVLVKSNPTVLSQEAGEGRVPKTGHKTGIEAILDNYKK
jgi:chromosome segregation ATPase